ncbi:thiol reductant ABC exporter subunit CydD [Nocardia flavorosea]|uniref:thiol reductant ABC exporter subunit CydD n=1 Tax=Nocardia flavorosea TaxID=53429 RepID=UPI001895C073|nr:thiol reductant ABC exporter subunit CydD [Nocardia flavorosea]MBF6349613.1 thiol reductant ABC exporter subunit CydD [Nocardia flavorosea]
MARPPVDPRLWRYARSARNYLVLSVGLSLLTTVAIVAAAVLLGRVLAGVITDPGQRTVAAWQTELVLLAVAVAVRALAAWWQARIAHRAGTRVVAELEQSVLAAGAGLPPRELESRRTELAVVVSSGLSGLRPYLTGYVPALLLAVLVPPVVLVVIAAHDLTSAVIVLITLPLIPIFMVLIGLLTEGRARATLDATTRLSDQLLDLFAGMPTLRALGRETGTAAETPGRTMSRQVRELGESLHRRTMSALRIAFLSSMVLELLATLSVALIAVAIGMRLVHGDMNLYAGVVALVLAPEVYLPLRTVGERFHAAQDGIAAAEKAFAVLDPAGAAAGNRPVEVIPDREHSMTAAEGRDGIQADDPPVRGVAGTAGTPESGADPDQASGGHERASAKVSAAGPAAGGDDSVIELRDLTIESRDGAAPDGLWARLRPGAVTALTGPNGSGKSTVLQAILGLIEPTRGAVLAGGVDIRRLPAEQWWQRLAWLPQRPVLVPGTLRENLELLGATVSGSSRRGAARVLSELDAACATTGFDAVLDSLPAGWDTVVGSGGVGLSLGQRQRLALTRVFAAGRPIVLLDEPTAHLDSDSEAAVAAALTTLARTGTTVVVVAHRPALLSAADEIVTVPSTAQRVAP